MENKVKISIIFPTRNRVSLLKNLYKSIQNTTDFSNVEVLVAYDYDDENTIKVINELPLFKFYGRERGNSISKDYQNWLYGKSIGKYIFVLNDDVEFKTPNWDQIAITKLDNYTNVHPDGIVYGLISDSKKKPEYSCFPILSRKAIDILGYVMHEYYSGWSADVYLYKVYKEAERVLDLSEILVQHYTHWQGNRNRDETNHNMERLSGRKDIINHINDSNKLKKRIIDNLLLL